MEIQKESLKKLLDTLLEAKGGHGMLGREIMIAMEQLTTDEYTALMKDYGAAIIEMMMGKAALGPWPPTEKRDDYGFRDVDGKHRMPMIDAVMSRVVKYASAKSVVDLGCATGRWLASALAHGATEVLGIDAYPPDEHLQIPATSFKQMELREPIDLPKTYDAAVCFWLGECVEGRFADTLVRNCVKAAPVVAWAAATPLQTGPRQWFHEQWPSWWAAKFASHGYVALDILREDLWGLPEVRSKLLQSIVLFVRRDHLAKLPNLKGARVVEKLALLDVVHPNEYLSVVHDYLHTVPIDPPPPGE